MNITISPSHTYVVIVIKTDGGHQFKKFTLPEETESIRLINNSDNATWYYLNYINSFDYVMGSVSFEDYQDLVEVNGVL